MSLFEEPTVEELREFPIFREIEADALDQLRRSIGVVLVPEGKVVFREGEPGDALFLIKEGEVVVQKFSNSGSESIASLEKGMVFGEIDFVLGSKRTATIRTVRDCVFLTLRRQSFMTLLAEKNIGAFQIVHRLAEILARRLQKTSDNLIAIIDRDNPSDLKALHDTWRGAY